MSSVLYEEMIREAIEKNASDIHITPKAKPMLRVNGRLTTFDHLDVISNEAIDQMIEELCPPTQIEVLKANGETNFSFSIPAYGRFRVSVIKQRGTFSISIRLFKLTVPTKETLGLPDVIFDLVENGRGLLVVSGASGSGRSTTMAALLSYLNERMSLNIITVESPIEYLFKHDKSLILQRDVGTDCASLYDGLISTQKHDPDVVMISDISDEKVLELAIQLAESGKLVIAGLPSLNTVTSIEAMVSSSKTEKSESRKHKLAGNILAIISQQLVPSKKSQDRLLIYELLLPNAAIRSHIMTNTLDELKNTLIVGKKQGMISMDAHLFEHYLSGEISQEVLYKYGQDIEFIKRMERNVSRGPS